MLVRFRFRFYFGHVLNLRYSQQRVQWSGNQVLFFFFFLSIHGWAYAGALRRSLYMESHQIKNHTKEMQNE